MGIHATFNLVFCAVEQAATTANGALFLSKTTHELAREIFVSPKRQGSSQGWCEIKGPDTRISINSPSG
jgi:hypothetical protein